jgi:DNA-binding MurR/RpiR family transcriptional regulator
MWYCANCEMHSSQNSDGMTLDPAPRDFAALKALIIARAADMPKRLVQVATFAVENPDEIAFGTAASIALSADVQPSTLVRFSQTLGYQGFSDLQEVFRSRLRERVLNYDERLEQLRDHVGENSKTSLIFKGFNEAAEQSLITLRNKIDPTQLDDAVKRLAEADTIYILGLRRSFPISSYMAYAFGKLGVKNQLVDAVGGLAAEEMSFITPKDRVFAVSFTPYASETIGLAQKAFELNVPVIAITDSPFSPLAAIAKPWFEVQESNFEGFRSMSATLALAMAITVAVADRQKSSRKK